MSRRSSLDWLNFLLADVRGGLGPYVNVFLLTVAGWDQATIGAVLTVSGLLGIVLHAPVGLLIDATRAKRGLLVGGALTLAVCAVAIALRPILPVVVAADVVMAVLGAVFAPTVAALTLGLVGSATLAENLGRNAAFDRAGNLFIATVAGVVGTLVSQRAVFFLVPFFAVLASLAILSIPAREIDHERARGFSTSAGAARHEPVPWRDLLRLRPFVVLAVAAAVFHFANGPMLALVAQRLALASPGHEAALTSAAIVVAQLATIPMALIVGRADRIGRKPLLVLAFAAVPLRGFLFAGLDAPWAVLTAQILDGVGAGLFDALLPLVLADVVRDTGRYNLARGLVGTVQGIGGASSYVVAGFLTLHFGYETAFLAHAAVGLAALAFVVVALPETGRKSE